MLLLRPLSELAAVTCSGGTSRGSSAFLGRLKELSQRRGRECDEHHDPYL